MKILDVIEFESQRRKSIIESGNYIKVEVVTPITDVNDKDDMPSADMVCKGKTPTPYELAFTLIVLDRIKQQILDFDTEDEEIKKCYEMMKKRLNTKTVKIDGEDERF